MMIKSLFYEKKARLLLFQKGGEYVVDRRPGLLPLWEKVRQEGWKGGFLADRVLGRGAAFLVLDAGIEFVFSPLMSQGAESILKNSNIPYEALEVVPVIKNRDGTASCPVEKLLEDIIDKEEACSLLDEFFQKKDPG